MTLDDSMWGKFVWIIVDCCLDPCKKWVRTCHPPLCAAPPHFALKNTLSKKQAERFRNFYLSFLVRYFGSHLSPNSVCLQVSPNTTPGRLPTGNCALSVRRNPNPSLEVVTSARYGVGCFSRKVPPQRKLSGKLSAWTHTGWLFGNPGSTYSRTLSHGLHSLACRVRISGGECHA